jgi:hypothetical protein
MIHGRRTVARLTLLGALFLVASTQTAGGDPPAARARDVAGLWRGGYAYAAGAGRPPAAFTAVIAQTPGGFEGTTCERATFGDRTTTTLTAVLREGSVDGTGRVRFTKRYDGRGGASHEVVYDGTLSTDGSSIKGTWATSPSETGTFTMRIVPVFPDVAGGWNGTYTYASGTKAGTPVPFSMLLSQTEGVLAGSVVEPSTFGDGSVERLTAAIREGTVEPDGRIRFVKRYDGRGGERHAVTYEGRLSSDGSKIEGTWSIRADFSGPFELVRR